MIIDSEFLDHEMKVILGKNTKLQYPVKIRNQLSRHNKRKIITALKKKGKERGLKLLFYHLMYIVPTPKILDHFGGLYL